MPRAQCVKTATGNLKATPQNVYTPRKINKLAIFIVCYTFSLNASAGWYTGGSLLLHPLPYLTLPTNYIELGSSRVRVLANGISINVGYRFCIQRYVLASELDIGGFSDADGDVIYKGIEHYVSAAYYFALKQKLGFYINQNFMMYGLLGLSQNSIGDRVYSTAQYYNKKQVSGLFGAGLEYHTNCDRRVALFAEWFYFTPTNMTLYSGGAKPPSGYSLSAYGGILQLGMKYYFE